MVVTSPEKQWEKSGFCPDTTNNRMEMQAVIEGLKELPEGATANIYTDSQYVQKGVEEWMQGWKRRGWRTAAGSSVKNQDLWREIDALTQRHAVTWTWVKGHAGHAGNERAHTLAHNAAHKKSAP